MSIIWKPITLFEEQYLISNTGLVRNLKTDKNKTPDSSRSYDSVKLYKNGKSYSFTIHRLVAYHFCYKPEYAKFVNHIDGNKRNNHYLNLEWVTPSENAIHAHRTGLVKPIKGSACSWSKLNEIDIIEIINLLNKGINFAHIARQFNVTRSCITNIVIGRNWKIYNSLINKNKLNKKLTKLTLIDQYGNIYKSLQDASEKTSCSIGNISSVINGRRKHSKGYQFRKMEDT